MILVSHIVFSLAFTVVSVRYKAIYLAGFSRVLKSPQVEASRTHAMWSSSTTSDRPKAGKQCQVDMLKEVGLEAKDNGSTLESAYLMPVLEPISGKVRLRACEVSTRR